MAFYLSEVSLFDVPNLFARESPSPDAPIARDSYSRPEFHYLENCEWHSFELKTGAKWFAAMVQPGSIPSWERAALFGIMGDNGRRVVVAGQYADGSTMDRLRLRKAAEADGMDVIASRKTATLPQLIAQVEAGIESQFGDGEAEGLIVYPQHDLRFRDGTRIMAKIRTRDLRGEG